MIRQGEADNVSFNLEMELRKHSIIETVNNQLKNISQIEHSRHRCPFNFFVNLIAGLVAYAFQEKKLFLNIRLSQALRVVMA
jgi:hypothetical protein